MGSGGDCGDDNAWMFSARLPAVIPVTRMPVVVPLTRRFAVPFWAIILAAVAGSVLTGSLAATLWPWNYHGKTTGIAALQPQSNDVSNAESAPNAPLATDEVTNLDLSLASLNTTNLGPADPNTTDVTPAKPSTAGATAVAVPATPVPVPVEVPAAPVPVPEMLPATPVPAKSATSDPAQTVLDACRMKSSGPLLVQSVQRTVLRADEPASLGLTINGALDGTQLLICGFAANSVFSAGRSVDESTWTIPAPMIADATIIPPHGFTGPMDLVVTLVNGDKGLVDRKTVYLQWLPRQAASQVPAPPRRDFANHDSLLSYGVHLKAVGNLTDARQIFGRVAQAGDPRGAFMLAETYDPISLAKHQLLPANSDIELARVWYRKATELGSPDAPGRLDRLTNW
jgi:hypothetical protein